MKLYHTGFSEIKSPDIHYGRVNADFGQGFYLSDDEEFSRRWARERRDETTFLNKYELECKGLLIKNFVKDKEWFNYIFSNRRRKPDALSDYDVIIGPIANDTIYDTCGILTSGFVDDDTALKVLMVGSVYKQIVIKSERAVEALHFTSSEVLDSDDINRYREIVKREEDIFQEEFGRIMDEIPV